MTVAVSDGAVLLKVVLVVVVVVEVVVVVVVVVVDMEVRVVVVVGTTGVLVGELPRTHTTE